MTAGGRGRVRGRSPQPGLGRRRVRAAAAPGLPRRGPGRRRQRPQRRRPRRRVNDGALLTGGQPPPPPTCLDGGRVHALSTPAPPHVASRADGQGARPLLRRLSGTHRGFVRGRQHPASALVSVVCPTRAHHREHLCRWCARPYRSPQARRLTCSLNCRQASMRHRGAPHPARSVVRELRRPSRAGQQRWCSARCRKRGQRARWEREHLAARELAGREGAVAGLRYDDLPQLVPCQATFASLEPPRTRRSGTSRMYR